MQTIQSNHGRRSRCRRLLDGRRVFNRRGLSAPKKTPPSPAFLRFYQGLSEVLNTIDAVSPQKRKSAPLAQNLLITDSPRRPSVDEAGVEQRDHSLLPVTQPLQPPQFPQAFSPHTVLSQFHRRAFSCALRRCPTPGTEVRRLHNADPRFGSIAPEALAAPDHTAGPAPVFRTHLAQS